MRDRKPTRPNRRRNRREFLYDGVRWVHKAQKNHRDFMLKHDPFKAPVFAIPRSANN